MRRILFISIFLVSQQFQVNAQQNSIFEPAKAASDSTAKAPARKWYETFSIRGYMQVRYNRLLETNENLGNEQGDKSWGKDGGFFIRRMRIIFYGQLSKQVYFYVQPDFASSPSSDRLHFAQIRDAYMDIGVDKKNEFPI
jgi:hypothetical protein